MLFYARKQVSPAGIQEYIFEMGLYYLSKMESLKSVLATFLKKYPGGITPVKTSWSNIIFDQELLEKMNVAFTEIKNLKT